MGGVFLLWGKGLMFQTGYSLCVYLFHGTFSLLHMAPYLVNWLGFWNNVYKLRFEVLALMISSSVQLQERSQGSDVWNSDLWRMLKIERYLCTAITEYLPSKDLKGIAL